MNAAMIAAMAAAAPVARGQVMESAPTTVRAPAPGRVQIDSLTLHQRHQLAEFERWLRTHEGIRPSETKQACIDRLASDAPSDLELALLDLKCSQRPSAGGD
jgi:hypothetical protein